MNETTNGQTDQVDTEPGTLDPAAELASGSFYRELREKVFGFLAANELEPIDERALRGKALIGFGMWLVSYVSYLVLGYFWGWAAMLAMIPMGFSLLCIVLSVMHDGSHSAFSQSRTGNTLAKWTLGFAGASPTIRLSYLNL